MIQARTEALPANGGTQALGPLSSGRRESDQTAMAAHPSHLAGGTGWEWLVPAAEMAGLASGSWWPAPDLAPVGWAGRPRIATCALGAGAGPLGAHCRTDTSAGPCHPVGSMSPNPPGTRSSAHRAAGRGGGRG